MDICAIDLHSCWHCSFGFNFLDVFMLALIALKFTKKFHIQSTIEPQMKTIASIWKTKVKTMFQFSIQSEQRRCNFIFFIYFQLTHT